MKPFERYAAIALLFLVTLVVVFVLWDDDGQKIDAGNGDADQEVARVEDPVAPRNDLRRSTTDAPGIFEGRAADDGLAVNGLDEPDRTFDRVTTRGVAGSAHSVAPGAHRDTERTDRGDRIDPQADELPSFEFAERERGPLRPQRIYGGGESNDRPASGFLARGSERPSGRDVDRETSTQSTPTSSASTSSNLTPPSSRSSVREPRTDGEYRTYVVRAGDVLSKIASRECGSLSAQDSIVSLNGLSDPDTIREGMELKLPREFAPASAATPSGRVASSDATRASNEVGRPTVTVREGEVLGLILERELGTYAGSIGLVRKLNPGLDPDRIFLGQTIVLPRADELPGLPAPRSAPRGAAVAEAPRLADNRTKSEKPQSTEFVVR